MARQIPPPDTLTDYLRAVQAEPRLQAVDEMVNALCELARRTDRMCYGCVWETIVKPLVLPLVGWSRGYPPRVARDPDPNAGLKVRSGHELLAEHEARQATRVPATTDTEKWLRTSEAYDTVTEVLLSRLERADPGNGHGIERRQKDDPR